MERSDRRKVPWFLWHWRLRLLFPMVLFAYMAVTVFRDVHAVPVGAVVFGAVFALASAWFARQTWRERFPTARDRW